MVAAGAVVTKDVAPGWVVGGVPAVIIRRMEKEVPSENDEQDLCTASLVRGIGSDGMRDTPICGGQAEWCNAAFLAFLWHGVRYIDIGGVLQSVLWYILR